MDYRCLKNVDESGIVNQGDKTLTEKKTHFVEIREPRHKRLIPYAALFLSVVTVGALIWQSLESRKHFRISVVPQINTYTTNLPQDSVWGLFLQNQGLGPAKIELQRLTRCDTDYTAEDMPEVKVCNTEISPDEVAENARKDGFIWDEKAMIRRLMGEEFYLEASAKTPILAFGRSSIIAYPNQEEIKYFGSLVNEEINLEYRWCSIYDECTEACTAVRCTRNQ